MKRFTQVFVAALCFMVIAALVYGAGTFGYSTSTNLQTISQSSGDVDGGGNIRVGDGTPTQTMDGEDLYVNGKCEVDGIIYADGGITAASITADPWTGDNGEGMNNTTNGTLEQTFNESGTTLGIRAVTTVSTTPADNDVMYDKFQGEDDYGRTVEYARTTVTSTDVSSDTLDSSIIWGVQTAGSSTAPTNELGLTGAALYPTTDGGLNIGAVSYRFGTGYINSMQLQNDETGGNSTDGVIDWAFNDDAVELGDFQFYSSNTSTSANDYLRLSWYLEDANSDKFEVAREDIFADDVTNNTVDSHIEWSVSTNDTLAAELNLVGSALHPEADEGLDLGTSALQFKDGYIDGVGYIDEVSLLNDETITNASDGAVRITADDDAVTLVDLQLYSSNTSTENGNAIRLSMVAEDSASGETTFGRMQLDIDDITTATEDSTIEFQVMSSGNIVPVLNVDKVGIYAENDDTYDVGKTGTRWQDGYFDGVIYGHNIDLDEGAAKIIYGNDESTENSTDGVITNTYDDDAAELGDYQFVSSNTSTSANDYLRQSWYIEDSGSVQTEAARMDAIATDVTSNTFDSTIEWSVVTADTLASELLLTGAMLAPKTNSGLDLGGSSNNFAAGYLSGLLTCGTVQTGQGATEVYLQDQNLRTSDNVTHADVNATDDLSVTDDAQVTGTLTVRDGTVTNALTVGSRLLVMGTGEIDSGAASDTLAVANTDSNDLVFVTLMEDDGTTTQIESAVPGSGIVTVTTNKTTATTVTFSYQVWQD